MPRWRSQFFAALFFSLHAAIRALGTVINKSRGRLLHSLLALRLTASCSCSMVVVLGKCLCAGFSSTAVASTRNPLCLPPPSCATGATAAQFLRSAPVLQLMTYKWWVKCIYERISQSSGVLNMQQVMMCCRHLMRSTVALHFGRSPTEEKFRVRNIRASHSSRSGLRQKHFVAPCLVLEASLITPACHNLVRMMLQQIHVSFCFRLL
jgi:hypothetical protein